MTEEENKKEFEKICIVYAISEEIVDFGVKCAGQEFAEFIDMNCGAMPDGSYEQLIDKDAPEQFLDFYKKIAVKRVNTATEKVIGFSPAAKESILKFIQGNCPEDWKDLLVKE